MQAQKPLKENAPFYFQALSDQEDIKYLEDEELLEYLGFDVLVRKYIDIPVVAKAMSNDLSITEIRNRIKLFHYIKMSNPKVDDRTAIIEVASVFWYGDKYKLPHSLIVGVLQTESNFNPRAVSSVNARGPMQVMWKYHSGLLQANGIMSEEELHDPEKGIAAGCLVLSRYLRAEKSVVGALKRYYGELSYRYVSTVLANYHAYELFALGVADDTDWLASEKKYWAKLNTTNKSSTQKVPSQKPVSQTQAKTVSQSNNVQKTQQNIRVFDLKGYIGVVKDGKVVKEWKKE
jgi:hypothetical protein